MDSNDILPSSNDDPTPPVALERSITSHDASIDRPQETSGGPGPARDEKYYLEFVNLLVEDFVFLVPSHHFMRYEGQFNWMRDTDEELPHKLDGITKADFMAFLKFIHPLYRPNQPAMTTDELASILKLASKWMMLDLRELAIKALDDRTWLQKIPLARTYGVISWLRDGYFDYVSRQDSMSVEDMRGLGMETALQLIKLREEKLQRNREAFHQDKHSSWRSCTPDSYQSAISFFSVAVDKELAEELVGAHAPRGADAVERVLWARSRNNVKSLRLAYIDLVERKDSISLDEASNLGLETTVKLCRAREKSLRSFPTCSSTTNLDPQTDIAKMFKEEWDVITDIGSLYPPLVTQPVTLEKDIATPASLQHQPLSIAGGSRLGTTGSTFNWGNTGNRSRSRKRRKY